MFLSYKYSNETKENLNNVVEVYKILDDLDYKGYCSIFDEEKFRLENWTGKQIMTKAFNEIDSSQIIFFLILSDVESPGAILELGYCLAKNKHLVLLMKNGVNNNIFARQISNHIIFEDLVELKEKLRCFKL
jgi:nucleoside 2-deoxyribosyltransferase